MQYVNLGTAGVKISRLALGTNMLGGYVDEQRSIELVHAFLDAGGNFIDEADVYGGGKSEEIMGKALKGRRGQAVLATKFNAPMGQGPNDKGNSRKHLMDSIEASLRRLQTDYIDLYIIHNWDATTHIAETLRTMDDLVRQGKIRYVGVSNFAAWQVVRALWVASRYGFDPVRSVQIEYSFTKRGPENDILPMASEMGLIVTPYWVLQAGILTGKYKQGEAPQGSRFAANAQTAQRMKDRFLREETPSIIERLEQVSREAGKTPAQVTIAWALSKPAIGSVIAGTSRPEQVRENCEAVGITLTEDQIKRLDTAAVPA
ncbi:MAG: aldo/keto reductase [SAR202 cluster bacterium]|nr:aldo/keto reductase [SAR202 cluster bacterium]